MCDFFRSWQISKYILMKEVSFFANSNHENRSVKTYKNMILWYLLKITLPRFFLKSPWFIQFFLVYLSWLQRHLCSICETTAKVFPPKMFQSRELCCRLGCTLVVLAHVYTDLNRKILTKKNNDTSWGWVVPSTGKLM